jgi:hypothetical protein
LLRALRRREVRERTEGHAQEHVQRERLAVEGLELLGRRRALQDRTRMRRAWRRPAPTLKPAPPTKTRCQRFWPRIGIQTPRPSPRLRGAHGLRLARRDALLHQLLGRPDVRRAHGEVQARR